MYNSNITDAVDNFFGDEGAEALVENAKKNPKIKYLGLCNFFKLNPNSSREYSHNWRKEK